MTRSTITRSQAEELARAAVHPEGEVSLGANHSTVMALHRRGWIWHRHITASGEREIRSRMPDLGPRIDPQELQEERTRAYKELSGEGMFEVFSVVPKIWTRELNCVGVKEPVRVRDRLVWVVQHQDGFDSQQGFTSAEDALRAAWAHQREGRRALQEKARSAALHEDIALGFLGGHRPAGLDVADEFLVVGVLTSRFHPHSYSDVEVAYGDSLMRTLQEASSGHQPDLCAVWYFPAGTGDAAARERCRLRRPDFGVIGIRGGLLSVPPEHFDDTVWE